LLAAPLACALAFALADPGLSRFVARRKGRLFLLRFTALHFAVHLALVLGAVTGGVRWLVDPRFGPSVRGRRDRPAPVAAP
ncbi:glycosyltransferase family 2 protein, partial [Streptomyces anulatus]